jgi:hypothetical protein
MNSVAWKFFSVIKEKFVRNCFRACAEGPLSAEGPPSAFRLADGGPLGLFSSSFEASLGSM